MMGNPKYESQRVEKLEKKHMSYQVKFPYWDPLKFVWHGYDKVTKVEIIFSPPLTVEEVYDRVDKMFNRG